MIVAKMSPVILSAPSLLPVIILIPLILAEKEKHEIRFLCEGNASRILDFTWAFFWSRNCSVTISFPPIFWERGTRLWIGTVLFVPCKALACLYFCTYFLTFLPSVSTFCFIVIRKACSISVPVENAILLAVIFFFLGFANEKIRQKSQVPFFLTLSRYCYPTWTLFCPCQSLGCAQ